MSTKKQKGENLWVSPTGNKWKVQREGSSRASRVFDTQSEAIAHATNSARNAKRGEVIVQGKDGRIRSKDSYGNDPYPPKDREH